MLSIGTLGGRGGVTAGRRPDYYEHSVASGREDYYTGQGEAPGFWAGAGADALGLEGELGEGELGRLAAGEHPRGEERLRTPVAEGAVWGFDLNFDAPKSVSLLFATGDEPVARAVREAHDRAVAQALGLLEQRACQARRGKAGREVVAGEGFVVACYRHRTSRAGDPHLHTHAVVGNLTRAEGRFSALDGRLLFGWAKTGGYLYQAALRAELAGGLGVDWGEVRNGCADVAGVPEAVLRHFSQRRAEIREEMARAGGRSGRSAQIAAYRTRAAKDYSVDAHRLREGWLARAAEHGFGPGERAAVLGRAAPPPPAAAELEALAGELAGPAGLTRERSTFDERDVLQAWAQAHRRGAPVARLSELAARFLSSEHAVALERPGVVTRGEAIRFGARADDSGELRGGRLVVAGSVVRYSTPEMLAQEGALVESAVARLGEGAGSVDSAALERALAARPSLGSDQRALVGALCRSGDGVQLVKAPAGSGKSYALDACRAAWQASGRRVYGCAVAARAAQELSDQAGIDASSVARLLSDLERGWGLERGSVLVCDEAGMVGTRALARLAGECERAGAKLVLVGDERQLPEIDAGGALRGLALRLGAVELSENRRQRDAAERAAVADLREGRVGDWARALDERGRLVVEGSAEQTRGGLVAAWWRGQQQAEPGEAVMLALRRSDVAELNERARAYMRQAGRLGERELDAGGRRFARGDQVIATANDPGLSVFNGWTGTVTAVDPEARSVSVAFDSRDEQRTLDADYLDAGKLSHGYAYTVHKAQGATRERVYVLGSDEMYQEWGYTAASRHRDELRFFVTDAGAGGQRELPDADADDPYRELERALGRSRAKRLALDIWEGDEELRRRPTGELASAAARLRPLLEGFPHDATAGERRAAEAGRARADAALARERRAAVEAERAELGVLERRRRRQELAIRLDGEQRALEQAEARAAELEAELARDEAAAEAWMAEHSADAAQLAAVERQLAERRARERERLLGALRRDPSDHVLDRIGARPDGPEARERWDRAALEIEGYRAHFGEPPAEHEPERATAHQRAAWAEAEQAIATACASEPEQPPPREPLRAPSPPALDVEAHGPDRAL